MSANQDSDESKGKLEPPDESKSVDSSDRTDNIDVAISSSLCFLTCLEISPKIEITNDINTVEHGPNITKKILGEHKVITPVQQFLCVILCFSMYLKWLWLLRFFAKML